MTHNLKALTSGLALCALLTAALSATALAADMSDCEVLLIQIVQAADEDAQAQIVSYRPAENFLKSIEDGVPGHMTQIDGQNIKALLCRRNDVIPAQSDYAVMSTGLPFILSQDFDSTVSDSLTTYWKDGKIEHVYKGNPLTEDTQAILDARLAEFSARGLSASAHEAADIAAKIKAKTDLNDQTPDVKDTTPAAQVKDDVISTNSRSHIISDTHPIQTEIETLDDTHRPN